MMCPNDGLRLPVDDLAAHDPTLDLLHAQQAERVAAADLKQLVAECAERKAAEQKLEEEHQRLASIIQGTNVGTWEWNVQTGETIFNDRWAQMLGYTLQELAPARIRTWEDVVHPEDRQQTGALLRQHFAGDRAFYECQARMKHKAGHLVWVQVRGQVVTRTPEGRPRMMFGTCADVTGAKRVEEEMQHQSRLQQLLMEISSTYINLPLDAVESAIQVSLRDLAVFVGADRAYIFDYDFARRVCTNTHEWCGDGIAPQIHELQAVETDMIPDWVETHRRGQPMYVPDVLSLPPGALRDVLEPQGIKSLLAVPMMSRNECVGFVGFDSVRHHYAYSENERRLLTVFAQMLVNVRMRKQADAELRETNRDLAEASARANEMAEQANAANRAKGDFLATMSHEIRTPMNGVLGMTELLLRTRLDGRQKEFVDGIAQSAQALLRVIDDVLDFSKIEAGRIEIVSEEFPVRPLVDAVLEVVSHRDPGKPISLAAIVHHDVPARVKGDPQRLRQVLLNLVGNAVKFTDHGEVTVRVQVLAASSHPLELRFEVCDSGIGLTEEQIERLFQPFVQGDQSSSRRFPGTGLGLAISRRLVDLMSGRVGVHSEPGRGSTFWFELPLGRADQSPAGADHPRLERAQAIVGIKHDGLGESLLEQFRSWRVASVMTRTTADLVREIESALRGGRVPFVVCEHDFYVEAGEALRQELARLGRRAFCLLLSRAAVVLAQPDEGAGLFQSVLFIPPKQSQVFDALVTAVEGQAAEAPAPCAAAGPPAPAAETVADGSLPPLRILLAEDHRINRRLCLQMIEGFGLTADTAENGFEVVAATVRQEYDLILMDCNMPEMDGYEATRSIRRLEAARPPAERRHVRIVALTANALIGERERCLGVGMDDFLSKPFTASELRGVILRSVQRNETAAAAASRLDQLAVELDRASVALMVQDYIAELPVRVVELERYLAEGKREELGCTAHALKGVSASLGLGELSGAFRALEEGAETGNPVQARRSFRALKTAVEPAVASLREWLSAAGHCKGS